MGKSDNIIKFEEAMKNDPEKQKAYEEALKKIVSEKSAESDGEAIRKAAKVVGFELTMEELERSIAEKQEVDDSELEKVSGAWCGIDHSCYWAFCHDDEISKEDACMKDYQCLMNVKTCTGKMWKDCEGLSY